MTQAPVLTPETQIPPTPNEGWNALERMWRGYGGLAVALALTIGFGLVSAWLTPRGPITTTGALVSMATAVLVGAAGGLTTGNRWTWVTLPLVFVVVFEIARVGVDGPSVDAIRGSMYGIIAFITGRFAHGILVLVPMALSSRYGVWAAARLGNDAAAAPGVAGWTFVGIVTFMVVAVAVFVARPASTAPILGPDGESLPGSVAELVMVEIGGHDQVLMIRGRSVDNPVLLYLAGGPGGTDLGAIRADVTLEQEFVVVSYEQRGAGKSYPALDPLETMTLEQSITDTIEVVDYLRERFDEDKVLLVGNSWGSTLGVLAAQRSPERFHAFVGVGQMVSQRATDVMFWEDTIAWAEANGDRGIVEELRRIGPPPYEDVTNYELALSHEHDWNQYPQFDSNNEMPAILFVPEYDWMDRLNAFRGFLDVASVVYPQLQEIDFRTDVPSLDVPLYMVQGEFEARGRAVLADEWFDMLEAPVKERTVVPGAGHRAHFDQPGLFAELMGRVLAESAGTVQGGTS